MTSHYRHWHHRHDTAYWYFEWKRRGDSWRSTRLMLLLIGVVFALAWILYVMG